MHIMNINDMGFWKPNQHYFTTKFRGPTTKINQYDCSIVGPVFSNIDQAAVSNDPVWSLCKMFCGFMTYVSERTCCHITDFRFEFTLVGYQSIACLKPRFEGGGREYSHIWAIIIHVCRVFWGSRNRWSIFITGWGFKTHTPITHVSDICGSTPWGYDVCDVFSVHVRSITIFSQVISL